MVRRTRFFTYLFVLITLSDVFAFGRIETSYDFVMCSVMFLGANADAVNDHLEKGKKLLAAGQLSDALTHFHSAIGKWNLSM